MPMVDCYCNIFHTLYVYIITTLTVYNNIRSLKYIIICTSRGGVDCDEDDETRIIKKNIIIYIHPCAGALTEYKII